jgi:hypothetical protein
MRETEDERTRGRPRSLASSLEGLCFGGLAVFLEEARSGTAGGGIRARTDGVGWLEGVLMGLNLVSESLDG